MSDITERNCNKCIHHTSGMCDSWNCKMQTVEDARNEAVNEYAKAVVKELEIERKTANNTYNSFNMNVDLGRVFGLEKAIEIVKQGGV